MTMPGLPDTDEAREAWAAFPEAIRKAIQRARYAQSGTPGQTAIYIGRQGGICAIIRFTNTNYVRLRWRPARRHQKAHWEAQGQTWKDFDRREAYGTVDHPGGLVD
jgi:hypothetical protein